MLYLVTWEYIESGIPVPMQQLPSLLRGAIVPSLQMCAELEKKRKIRGGGVFAGARASAIVLDADSNEEASRLLQSLPFWSLMKFNVTPLQAFEDRAKQEAAAADMLEAAVKTGHAPA